MCNRGFWSYSIFKKCDNCGRVVDEWSYNPATRIFLCFDCEEKEEKEEKLKTIIYSSESAFCEYYLIDLLGKPLKVTEEEFYGIVGTDRRLVPMHYDTDNVNRQNFYLDDKLIGYRVR